MKRSNHQLQGVLFVVVCVLVALIAYIAIHGSARRSNDGNMQAGASGSNVTMDMAQNLPPDAVAEGAPEHEEAAAPEEEHVEQTPGSAPTDTLSPAELAERAARANAEQGDCYAIVNVEVSSTNKPYLILPAHSKLEHVTALLRDTKSGDTAFCNKNVECFPTRIEQDGKIVTAIELTSCEVRSDYAKESEGIEVYLVS
jgi:hypothetical protein